MRFSSLWKTALLSLACGAVCLCAQEASVDVNGHVELPRANASGHKPAVVAWLNPVNRPANLASPPPGRFKLVQKNRMFSPHLLVIPTGSVVSFPNADPFFHNVFSLFNGKRFDLGLYEAGSSKDVVFSREGVSYIFCNIHPEMSAVVVSLSTPLFAVSDASGKFMIRQVPAGEYELHVWIEGAPQPTLDRLARRVRIHAGQPNIVTVDASAAPQTADEHLNKFGMPYDRDTRPMY